MIVNNQTSKVRVVARDAACNAVRATSAGNFTIWNPPASFTHIAEAPIYLTSGGFDAYIYLCNGTMNSIVAELDFHQPIGDATPNAPAQIGLVAGDSRKIRVADYLTLGNSAGSVEGSVRLRHNGSTDLDVQAMLVVNKFGEEQSFTSPFVYPVSSQAADSTMQCSPIYYLDDLVGAWLALQNCRNYPVDVNVKLVYGTGDPSTPNGTYYLPAITLAGQGRLSTSLAAYKDQLQGAKWGSLVVSAPAQSVAAHCVMRSTASGVALSSSFVDPRMSSNTTKVAGGLKLDYDSATEMYLMICNTSSTDTRTVTASFQTDNGVALPSRQVTVSPGQQKMIELDPRQLLSAHQSAMADVRLTYTGNASDIVAGAMSMSGARDYVSGARLSEPSASDGRRLMSPFFRVDARTRGFVQISNLGANTVRAGCSLKFVNASLPAVTTDLVTVAAGRTAILDLQPYIEQSPDGLVAEGCLELIHNGPPGTVTCSFISMTPDPNEVPVGGGGPPMCHTQTFPSDISVQPGDSVPVYLMTCGETGPFVWSATVGTVTPQSSPDPNVFAAVYTLPSKYAGPDEASIQVTGPGFVGTIDVDIQKVKLQSIATNTAQGVDTGGRLNPDGGTRFVLTGKAAFPTVPLRVVFRQGDLSVPIDIPVDGTSRPAPTQLAGTAPSNTLFIGDAEMFVFADNGNTRISKKTLCDAGGCSAYYAFDKPTPPTSVSVPGFNRLGGNLTITAAGGGFRDFRPTIVGAPVVAPTVNIEEIDFAVNTVNTGTPSSITGNVQPADASIQSCQVVGQSPCKTITVRNPGGRNGDRARSVVPLYSLLAGPAPIPQTRFPDSGFSIGGALITITGQNLDFTARVTVGGTLAPIINKNRSSLVVSTLPHLAGATAIVLFDIDNAAPGGTTVPGAAFTYLVTPVTELGGPVYIVGPGEGVDVVANSLSISQNVSCVTGTTVLVQAVSPPSRFAGALAFRANGSFDCRTCVCSLQNLPCPKDLSGTFAFTLANTASAADTRLRLRVTRTANVRFDTPPLPPFTRECIGFF